MSRQKKEFIRLDDLPFSIGCDACGWTLRWHKLVDTTHHLSKRPETEQGAESYRDYYFGTFDGCIAKIGDLACAHAFELSVQFGQFVRNYTMVAKQFHEALKIHGKLLAEMAVAK